MCLCVARVRPLLKQSNEMEDVGGYIMFCVRTSHRIFIRHNNIHTHIFHIGIKKTLLKDIEHCCCSEIQANGVRGSALTYSVIEWDRDESQAGESTCKCLESWGTALGMDTPFVFYASLFNTKKE